MQVDPDLVALANAVPITPDSRWGTLVSREELRTAQLFDGLCQKEDDRSSSPPFRTVIPRKLRFRRHTLEILHMIWLRLDNLTALMGTVLEAVNKHKEDDDDNFPVQEPPASYDTFMESKCQLQASEAMRKKAVDNYYNSPELVDKLIARKTDVYGTTRPRRKEMPNFDTKRLRKVQHCSALLCIALQCDKCDSWLHRKCELLSLHSYRRLSSSEEEWYCGACQLPAFDDELFPTCPTPASRGSDPTRDPVIANATPHGQAQANLAVKEDVHGDASFTKVSRSTLWRALQNLGFRSKKPGRNSTLLERTDLILWRARYLWAIKAYRAEERLIYFLDETRANAGQTRSKVWKDTTVKAPRDTYNRGLSLGLRNPSRNRGRVIILHAGSEEGFVQGAAEVFSAKKGTSDYHQKMDSKRFEKWFTENLLPNIKAHSMVVMDNASSHSVKVYASPSSTLKEDVQG
ncbi:uncharacterized protein ISCGN_011624 [Ixodes scapularis]